jgi:phosphatidylserine/phosphatidylglycerophosphate/cardiolipin synthase-like enzyme
MQGSMIESPSTWLHGLRSLLGKSPRRVHGLQPDAPQSRPHHGNDWAVEGAWSSTGNRVQPLVDGKETFATAAQLIRTARAEVRLLQMAIGPEFVPDMADPRTTLVGLLRHAGQRGVQVRLLHGQLKPVDALEFDAVAAALADAPGVRVRAFPTRLQMQHAKLLLVDGKEAMVLGSLFLQAYWDTQMHHVVEPRRLPATRSLQGPVVADVDGVFIELWNHQAPPNQRLAPWPRPRPRGKQHVQLLRALPAGMLPSVPRGQQHIMPSYALALARARRVIYIENQYLTYAPLVDALLEALEREPQLECILLLNPIPDIPTYRRRQLALLRRLEHPRVGVFSLWYADPNRAPTALLRGYVHSKVCIIDDDWLMAGSANLDGFSLEGPQRTRWPANSNVEVNVGVADGCNKTPCTGVARRLRRQLWQEHGLRGAGGLADWHAHATHNVACINAGRLPPGPVLPFPVTTDHRDKDILVAAGLDPLRFQVLP